MPVSSIVWASSLLLRWPAWPSPPVPVPEPCAPLPCARTDPERAREIKPISIAMLRFIHTPRNPGFRRPEARLGEQRSLPDAHRGQPDARAASLRSTQSHAGASRPPWSSRSQTGCERFGASLRHHDRTGGHRERFRYGGIILTARLHPSATALDAASSLAAVALWFSFAWASAFCSRIR